MKFLISSLCFLAMLDACKSRRSTLSDEVIGISPRGTKKALFTGYDQNSREFIDRICIVPSFAMDTKSGQVMEEFLVPEVFSVLKPNELDAAVARLNANNPNAVSVNTFNSANQSGSIEYSKDASSSELLNKLAGGFNVKMDMAGGGSLEGGAEIALNSGISSRSTNQVFIAKITARSVQVNAKTAQDKWVLTRYGETVRDEVLKYAPDLNKQREIIVQNCGSHYVSQVNFGSLFMASLKAIAKMQSDLDHIAGKLKIKTSGGIEGGGDACVDNSKLSSDVKVELKIYQQGGNPVSLLTLFSSQGQKPAPTLKLAEDAAAAKPDNPRAPSNCPTPSTLPDDTLTTTLPDDALSKLINCDAKSMNACREVFYNILKYSVGANKLTEVITKGQGEDGKPLDGTTVDLLKPYLADQLGFNNTTGFVVNGYSAAEYMVGDFASAGMFGETKKPGDSNSGGSTGGTTGGTPPPTPITAEQKTAPIASLSIKVGTKLSSAANLLKDIIDVWAYIRDAQKLINNTNNKLDLGALYRNLLKNIGDIQATFSVCRDQPSICEAETDRVLEAYDDTALLKSYMGKVEKIIFDEIAVGGFYQYCQLTSLRRFKDEGELSPWRQSMFVLADRLGMGPPSRDFLTYKMKTEDNTVSDKDLAVNTKDSEAVKKINGLCDPLTKLITATELNYESSDPAYANLILEPVTYMPALRKLTFNYASGTSNVFENLVLMKSLRDLEIKNAVVLNPYVLAQIPSLYKVKFSGYGIAQTDSSSESTRRTVTSTGLRELLHNPIVQDIQFDRSPGNATPVNIDLKEFPNAYKKGFINEDNRTILRFVASGDSQFTYQGIDEFFGFSQDRVKKTCNEVYDAYTVGTWAGLEFGLSLGRAARLKESLCCAKVKARCEEVKGNLEKGDRLDCEITCKP